MRIFIQLITLIFLTLPSLALADGGEDYYKAVRKLKKFDPATMEKIKRETIDAEKIKKVNAMARANTAHNKQVDSMPKKGPPTNQSKGEAPTTAPAGKKITAAPKMLPAGTKKYASKSKPVKTATSKSTVVKKEEVKKPVTKTENNSADVKVNKDGPDELSFPGTAEATATPKKK